jgi:hypothetical protein
MMVSSAEARGRGPRGGVVMGPNGPLYDTRSAEWRMSGGDINAYQAIMQQKMMMQQQKFMMQQMQQMQKMQKNGKGKADSAGQLGGSNLNFPNAGPVNHYRRKTYKHGVADPNAKPKADKAK